MTELQGHEDRLEISADSSVFVRSREEGSHGRSRVGGSAPPLCQRAGCYQSHPWDLLGRLIAALGLLQLYPHGADHPPFQEARSDATGSVAHDFQIAVQDLGRAVDRQRLDLLARHPRAVLAWPSATPRPRRLWNLIEREVPADPADDSVAGREGAFDQPSAHEPGIEQDAHPAEPGAKQAQQEAGALELATIGATADQAQYQRHRADLPLMFDDRGQAQPALATQEPRPVRLSRMIVMDQRPRRPGGNRLDQRVIEDHVPDRRGEQALSAPPQGPA